MLAAVIRPEVPSILSLTEGEFSIPHRRRMGHQAAISLSSILFSLGDAHPPTRPSECGREMVFSCPAHRAIFLCLLPCSQPSPVSVSHALTGVTDMRLRLPASLAMTLPLSTYLSGQRPD